MEQRFKAICLKLWGEDEGEDEGEGKESPET